MKKIISKITWLLACFVAITACQEPYEADYLSGNEKIPVIKGAITNAPGPYTITLSWASTFKKYSNTPIYGAKVTISDDAKNSELLKETNNGRYITKVDGIQGIVGRKYKLTIKLTDGKVLESPLIKLQPALTIDTIYASIGKITTYEQITEDDLITKTYDGLYIYADISSTSSETQYAKFDNAYIWQRTRIQFPNSAFPPTIYYRTYHKLTDLPDVNATMESADGQKIIKQPLGFIPYVPDLSMATDSLSPYFSLGWIVCADVSNVSQNSFKYYENVAKQLKAGAKIFDPVPSQITGNMKCRGDSTYTVLGLFDVYSRVSKYTAFLWFAGSTVEPKTKNITDPGPLLDEEVINDVFPYWVYFY